jgi:hypothetical protein
MASSPAVANGPISFTDKNACQASLPLSDVYFEGNKIKAKGAIYTTNKTLLDLLLAHLAKVGAIVAGSAPAAQPVMVIKAKNPGSNGNWIQVQFKDFDNSTASAPKFNVMVTETDTYSELTPGTAQKVLGSATAGGTCPGLVVVPGAAPAATALPKAGTYALAGAGAAQAATVDIPLNAGGGNAFTLQAKAVGEDGALTSVEIKDVDATASTFTLVASWKKETSTKIGAGDVGTTFSYEIVVSAPEGGALGAPAAATVTLSGGADAAAAVQASATVSG